LGGKDAGVSRIGSPSVIRSHELDRKLGDDVERVDASECDDRPDIEDDALSHGFYTSTASPTLGASWGTWTVTGCQTSIQPTVVAAGSNFHVMSSYVWPNDSQKRLAQVDWLSTNGGKTWVGNGGVAGPRHTPGPISPTSCFWGDYQAATLDLTGVLYSWGQFDSNTNLWDVQGTYINP
jgi:hypothetical protein